MLYAALVFIVQIENYFYHIPDTGVFLSLDCILAKKGCEVEVSPKDNAMMAEIDSVQNLLIS